MNSDSTLKENTTHGTKKNPIVGMQFRTGPGTAYPEHFFVGRHWHHAAEILFITKGSYLFEINLETYRLNAGDICFLNSGDLHQITGLETDTTHEVVIFDPHILEFAYPDELQEQVIAPFVNHERIFRNTLCTADRIYSSVVPLIRKLIKLAVEAEHNWYLSCKLLLLELLSVMTEEGFLQQTDSAWSAADKLKVSRYKEIVSYIEKHYAESISLKDLADTVSCNGQYLCRFFKEITGSSPIQYLIAYRIERACVLLSDTTMSVLEISMECGFDNASYFIRKFRQLKGCTPKQFRKAAGSAENKNTVCL